MKTVTLGKTNLVVTQLAFGALPIQRTSMALGVAILRKAYDNGITFFDTARGYSDSERKLGRALAGVRQKVVVASKTPATDAKTAREHLEISLRELQTDYIDIVQLHNPERLPDPDDAAGAYAALVAAKRQGLVRHIGITNHRAALAREAVASGLFETLQFPLSHISSPEDLSLIDLCRQQNVGLIAMKALCGGLITNIPAAFAFFRQFDNVAPIWGMQHESELDQFLALEKNPPALTAALQQAIDADRRDLAASFCRGCGYCLPCPAQVPIPMAARMSYLLRRAPYRQFLTEDWRAKMQRIDNCTDCRSCAGKCPYGLDTPALLKGMLKDYVEFAAEHAGV
jgi:aryl-alcohol dehydrogenase-like predicted oxidoreductase